MDHVLVFDNNKLQWRNTGEYLNPYSARLAAVSYREEDLVVLIVGDSELWDMQSRGRVFEDDVLDS